MGFFPGICCHNKIKWLSGRSLIKKTRKGHDIKSSYYLPLEAYIGGIYSRRWIPIEKRPTWPSRATMGFRELAIVTEWKFKKDEIEIAMRDITNNTKGSQLDCSRCTFTGLDDDRLSQWYMRDWRGMVLKIVEHLRRLDVKSPVNDDEHSAMVESSIISNILSMDFDGCDDDSILPQTVVGMKGKISGLVLPELIK
nr:protein CYPRO4 [Tanacetum cinerariifolium]